MRRIFLAFSSLLLGGLASGQHGFDSMLKARAMLVAGKPAQAVEILTSAINVRKEPALLEARAEAYIEAGNLRDAIADLNDENSIIAGSGEYGLARAYALSGDVVTALTHLEQNLRSEFKKSEKEIMLDPAFTRIENEPEWRTFWKKNWYTRLEEGISEIEYYISAKKTDEAGSVYSEIAATYPDREETAYAKSLIDISAGRFADAVKSLASLTASEPKNEKYLRLTAKAQAGLSNYAGASAIYTKLIAMEIPDAGLLIDRCGCFMKTGETDRARADIALYLEIYPEDKTALKMAGKVEESGGNSLEALRYFSKNIELHPGDAECYSDRAGSYFVSRSWKMAADDYAMSLDLNPGNSDVWLSRGLSLVNSGDTEDACHDFRMALSLGNKKATDYISRYCIK